MIQSKTYAVMVEGMPTPTRTYDNYPEAETEAKRLTTKEKRTSYVLLAITKLELNEVKITSIA